MYRAVTAVAALALVAASAVVSFVIPASADVDASLVTLYVAAAGDDAPSNPCTASDAPCMTVSGAVTRAQTAITDGAVDVSVNIAAGTYTENVTIGAVATGHSLSLIGAAASTTTIHGLGTASVISVTSGVVNLTGLTITGGSAANGGGINNGAGTLTVSNSTVTDNTATGSGTLAGGGGVYNNAGTLTVSGSTVSDNTATTSGGNAGGIFNNTGTLSVSGSTLSGNAGWYVGGIHNRGTLTVSGSTVSENTSTKNQGGGISNYGTMTVSDSTLSGNTALNTNLGKGGAIYNKGPATVTNSTLSGNSAYQGGGIYTTSKLLTVSNSTLSGNSAYQGGGIFAGGSPGVNISNSILSGSSCSQSTLVVDGGYNVSDDSCFWSLGPTSLINSTTIGLSPLAANGSTGPQTMAIGASSSAHHLVPACTGTDQRGLARPGFGGSAKCDAGAYELQGLAPAVTTDPQSQTLAIGSDAVFTAAASGAPSPTVIWQANTGMGWANVSGATATTLTLTGVTHAMSGNQYRAVFTNGVASAVTTAAATLTVPVGALDHLVVSPSSETMVAGGSRAFTAEGFDSVGNSLGDVTGATVFTGSAGLSCAAATCTSNQAGTYTVTGTDGAATGTASLTVTAGVLDRLVVSPSSGTVVAGSSRAFTAEGFDSFGNSLGDVTGDTAFAGSNGATCAAATCTSTRTGTYTVTGTNGGATGTASLTVTAGALDHLVVSPSAGSVVAGGSQVFTAEGFDSFGNSLGDVTSATVFTGSTGLECTVATCTSNQAGTYTVTGTDGAATGTASLTVTAGALDHLVVSPSSGSVVAGGSQVFTAEGFDSVGNSLGDVTSATRFTGSTGLGCTVAACTSNQAGTYTVTGTNGGATGTASLTVTAGALDHLVVSPSSGSVVAGSSRAFTAEGFDSFGNSLGDVTGDTAFAGSNGAACAAGTCTSTRTGTYTVTGTNGAATGTASLTVTAGALDRLVVSPSSGTVVAGSSRAFTAEGFDSFGNSLGDVTGATVFTGSAGLTCGAAACTSKQAGTYTVTGTNGAATGTASLTVTAVVIPEVNLPTNKPRASGPVTGVPAMSYPGGQFTATVTGFAPHAPVTFGIYSTVRVLGHAIADSNGTAVAHLQIPAGFVGSHTVVAAGMDPSLKPRYLETPVLVVLPVAPANPASNAPLPTDTQLPATGVDAGLNALSTMGFLLFMLGSFICVAASRRQRGA